MRAWLTIMKYTNLFLLSKMLTRLFLKGEEDDLEAEKEEIESEAE